MKSNIIANEGRIMTCGASAAFLNHRKDEPTVFDKFASMLKGIVSSATKTTSAQNAQSATSRAHRRRNRAA